MYQESQLLPFIRNLAKVPVIETRDVLNAIKKSVPEEVSSRIENVTSLLAIMLGKSVSGIAEEPVEKLSGWQTSERSWANVAPGLRPGQSIESLSSEIINFQ